MSEQTLWIGDIENWMDENYLKEIFKSIAEVKSVKVMKKNGFNIGYGFLEFENKETSNYVLENFNGKAIPGTNK